jgi:hypothetical protein
MQSFADWIASQPGLLRLLFLKDSETGDLVGISVWDRKENWERAMQRSMQARGAEAHNLMTADFAESLQVPIDVHMHEVLWQRLRIGWAIVSFRGATGKNLAARPLQRCAVK